MSDDALETVARILAADDEQRYDEADRLLDRARADYDLMFDSQRFAYALYRARLAARRGQRDEAAAFACGALWQSDGDESAVRELERYAAAGDGARYSALADDFRSPDDGSIQWEWSLIERLRPNPELRGRHDDEIEAGRRAAEPLLMELRAAGFPAYDLQDFSMQKLPSKQAAVILVKWLGRIDDPLARTLIATALTDTKARSVATEPLLDLFDELPAGAREKDRVANALATLARDRHFERVAALIRDPRHGYGRLYLFAAVGYMKDPRAVDLCLEFLDDAQLGMTALRALADLRSEQARPVLERIAAEPTTRGRSDEAQRQRDRVRLAENGLAKLDRA